MFANGSHYIGLDYLRPLAGLKEGDVLMCEKQVDGRIVDRRLIHNKYNDECQYLERGERVIVRRASTNA